MKRKSDVCKTTMCPRHERYGTPPVNTSNFLCLFADSFRSETKAEYEEKDVPEDCLFKEKHSE
jgi:hypothetical protein